MCILCRGHPAGAVVVEWFKALDWRREDRGFDPRHGTCVLQQSIFIYIAILSYIIINCQAIGISIPTFACVKRSYLSHTNSFK